MSTPISYHEMTVGQPRDPRQNRRQLLVLSTIMTAFFAHSVITAGGLSAIEIKEGIFPGGFFTYRYSVRDYAATYGLFADIGDDLKLTKANYSNLLYALYLDDPSLTSHTRFGIGILGGKSGKPLSDKLLKKNKELDKEPIPADESVLTNMERFRRLEWLKVNLPSVDAAVVRFPHTGGFVSALVTSYKIIPAMRRYVEENGEKGTSPVVISTCNTKQQMCIHYAPLVHGKKFLLGQPGSKAYLKSLPPETFVDWEGVRSDAKKYFPPFRWILD